MSERVKVAQSCPALCDPWTVQSMGIPGWNTGVKMSLKDVPSMS